MADYNIPNDGKLHTRWSELIRCTPGQIDTVIAERFEGRRRAETESMAFGTDRHEMWQEEAEKTGYIPACFGNDTRWPVSHVEKEFATEILPGIVVHSRIDTLCAGIETIVDYKTVLDGKRGWEANIAKYRGGSKQLTFYAFQVGLHGHRIRHGAYLCEIWSADREEIIGYEAVKFPIQLTEIAEVVAWVKKRAAMLAAAVEAYQSKTP